MKITESNIELLAKAKFIQYMGDLEGWAEEAENYIMEVEDYVEATKQPLSDFMEPEWNEWSGRETFSVEGFDCIYFDSMQGKKGDPRENFFIVNIGEKRIFAKGV